MQQVRLLRSSAALSSQLMMMMIVMMIMSMHDGRADRCSHFRCRTTYTHACIYIYEKHTHVHAYLSIWEEFKFSIPSRNSIFQFLLRYCVIAVLYSLLHLQQSKAKAINPIKEPYGPSHSIKRCNVVFISMHASTQQRATNAASTLEKLVSSWARLHICVICGISRARSPARCAHRSKSYPEMVPHTARCSARRRRR